MKKLFLLFVIFSLVFTFNTCKTDFDINAPWKDVTIVYGLLDKSETTHYVRINKAFLGDGNALIMARSFDSSNYKKTHLDVKIEEYTSGGSSPRNIYPLSWDTVKKDVGVFYDPNYPYQTVYKTNAVLNENYIYKLKVTNLATGKLIAAETNLIYPFVIQRPGSLDKFTFKGNQSVVWSSARNGRTYQLVIRFNYDEINKNTLEIIPKFVDWVFEKQSVTDLNGGVVMKYEFKADQFYFILSTNIKENPDVRRKAQKADFMLQVAGDEFNTYLLVNEPSNSIVQERPNFTNISNGLGIFSCRNNNVRSLSLSTISIDSLVEGRYTKHLGFERP